MLQTTRPRSFRLFAGWLIFSLIFIATSNAHADVVIFKLDNVMLAGGGQITGTFSWTYDAGDFENGVGEFVALEIPYTIYSLADGNLNIDIQPDSIEISGNGNYHDVGLDITLSLTQPFSPTQSATIDLGLSFFECCGNGFQDQPFLSGSILATDIVPVEVVPDSYQLTAGINVSGGLQELTDSDDSDLVIRPFGPTNAEFEIKGVSPFDNPSAFEVTLEASVSPIFSNVDQVIELYDYDAEAWGEVDVRRAGRIDDDVATVAATGDLSRFVETGTRCVKARICFTSNNARRRFVSATDQFKWTIIP
jgi:hypothetical protein